MANVISMRPNDEFYLMGRATESRQQLVLSAALDGAQIGGAGMDPLQAGHQPRPLLVEPAARRAASSGKLIWMSAALNAAPANHSSCPARLP